MTAAQEARVGVAAGACSVAAGADAVRRWGGGPPGQWRRPGAPVGQQWIQVGELSWAMVRMEIRETAQITFKNMSYSLQEEGLEGHSVAWRQRGRVAGALDGV